MSIQWASSQSCSVKRLPHIYVNTTYSAKCKFSVRKLYKNMLGEIKSAKKELQHKYKMDVAVSNI